MEGIRLSGAVGQNDDDDDYDDDDEKYISTQV